jgi:hypothetical protein
MASDANSRFGSVTLLMSSERPEFGINMIKYIINNVTLMFFGISAKQFQ